MEASRSPSLSGACGVRFFFRAEDGIRDVAVTGVQTCALPIYPRSRGADHLGEHFLRQVRQRARRRTGLPVARSEERRVGKERRPRGTAQLQIKINQATAIFWFLVNPGGLSFVSRWSVCPAVIV